MAKKTPNVVNLATKRKSRKPTAAKTKAPVEKVEEVVEVVEVKEPTVDELAEQRVKDLLKDVDLKPKGDDDLLELDEEVDDGLPKSQEWLEEQVGALGTENERLRSEAAEAKENYSKLYERYEQVRNGGEATDDPGAIPQDSLVPDSLVKRGALALFDEFQTEYLRHRAETRAQTKITLVALIQKMLEEFPFLSEYKKF